MPGTLRTVQNETTVFNNVTLTAAFSGNVSGKIDIGGVDQVDLFATFTPATNGDNNDIQVEYSYNGSTWFIEQAQSTSTGTTTVVDQLYTRDGAAAATVYRYHVSFPVSSKFMRLSTRFVGTGAGTLTLVAAYSGI